MIGTIAAAVIPALLLICVAVGLLVVNKRAVGGFWLWEQRRLYKEGIRASGRVLNRVDRGYVRSNGRIPINRWDLVVELHGSSTPHRRLSISRDASTFDPITEVGAELPLRIDPRDEGRVMIDDEELDRAKAAKEAAAVRKNEEERRALLGGQPPR